MSPNIWLDLGRIPFKVKRLNSGARSILFYQKIQSAPYLWIQRKAVIKVSFVGKFLPEVSRIRTGSTLITVRDFKENYKIYPKIYQDFVRPSKPFFRAPWLGRQNPYGTYFQLTGKSVFIIFLRIHTHN